MLLEKVVIRDFRGIEYREIDFTDELKRVRMVAPIAGPNTSGKTSILDAISLCLMPVTEMFYLPAITLTPAAIVRRGAIQAKVSCTVRFSPEEIDALKDIAKKANPNYINRIPAAERVIVNWEYPDRNGKYETGFYKCDPSDGWTLFKGRMLTKRNLYLASVSLGQFKSHGGVFQFDQQRQGLAKRISRVEKELLNVSLDEDYVERLTQDDGAKEFTIDPKIILLSLAMRANAEQDAEATQKKDFERLRELYATTCRPHTIKGLYNTDTGLDMEFSGPEGIYGFHGLSSGQQMILLLLLNFATKHIHRSIVMIDELELNLHPLWQDRLYQSLHKLGVENQIIFTTHSSYLRKSIGRNIVLSTGELAETQA
ncbi:MAG: AAA family ATPase [Gammaproteobacteria bacterium]|nr:AAA family ATPase [Gammaproteobacteria bacterium]